MEGPSGNKNSKCIILSAGLSERMNSHKALLSYNKKESFLLHIIKVYRGSGIKNISVIINPVLDSELRNDAYHGVAFIRNQFPERGRLYSLQLGLQTEPEIDYCFVQNIDNPFVTREIIEKLYQSSGKADYITPVYNNKGGHPILISSRVIRQILQIEKFDLTLRDELEKFSRYKVPVDDDKVLANIDTRENYKKYFNH